MIELKKFGGAPNGYPFAPLCLEDVEAIGGWCGDSGVDVVEAAGFGEGGGGWGGGGRWVDVGVEGDGTLDREGDASPHQGVLESRI
jgi:hypothetical protein